jgi:hypothetical protein
MEKKSRVWSPGFSDPQRMMPRAQQELQVH